MTPDCVAVLEVFQVKAGRSVSTSGHTVRPVYRRILENCTTTPSAALLESMPRTAIAPQCGGPTGTAWRCSKSRRAGGVRPPVDGLCVTTNHFCSPELRPLVHLNLYHTDNRFQSLAESSRGPEALDLAAVFHCLDGAHMAGTLQAMIFEPAALRLNLSIGVKPATDGQLRPLDLGGLFQEVTKTEAARPSTRVPE